MLHQENSFEQSLTAERQRLLKAEALKAVESIARNIEASGWGIREFYRNSALIAGGYQQYQLILVVTECDSTTTRNDVHRTNILKALSECGMAFKSDYTVIEQLINQLEGAVAATHNPHSSSMYQIVNTPLKQTLNVTYRCRASDPIKQVDHPADESTGTGDDATSGSDESTGTTVKENVAEKEMISKDIKDVDFNGKLVYFNNYFPAPLAKRQLKHLFHDEGAKVIDTVQFGTGFRKLPVDYYVTVKDGCSPTSDFLTLMEMGDRDTRMISVEYDTPTAWMRLTEYTAKEVAEMAWEHVYNNSTFIGKRVFIPDDLYSITLERTGQYNPTEVMEVIKAIGGEVVTGSDENIDINTVDMTFTHYVPGSNCGNMPDRIRTIPNVSITTFNRKSGINGHYNFDDILCIYRGYKQATDDSVTDTKEFLL